jgi:hypothetical protein
MSLPIVVIMTSASCGHCVHMRGNDGSFMPENDEPSIKKDNSKGWAWNETFFKNLLTAGSGSSKAKCRVFEIHLSTLQPLYENIIEFSEFELEDKGEVSKNTYYIQNNKLMNTFVIGYRSQKNLPEPTEVTDVTFQDFIRRYIPTQIVNFAFAFPGWFFCKGDIWDSSITNNTPLFGYLSSVPVIKLANGQFGADRRSESMSAPEDPVTVIKKIVNGSLNLDYSQVKSGTNLETPPVTPGFILLPK